MNPLLLLSLSVGAFVISLWVTERYRRFAIARSLLDVPNARSSHVVATPRGGGVAIVLATLAAMPLLASTGALAWASVWGFSGGGALVGLIGFLDDKGSISRWWRLLGHFVAAAWVLVWLGGLPSLPMMGLVLDPGWLGHALAVLYLVWILNLTNFMDGIDGIAGVEVITVCLGGALLSVMAGTTIASLAAPLVLASATFGFLLWNWPPAKIFMGDVGSGFLGLMLAGLSLQAGWVSPRLFWGWVILLGVFVVDATVTLVSRVARGERFYEAHRSHAYQLAAQWCKAHQPVTLAVGAINLFWLLPVAMLVALNSMDGMLGVLIAYTPLVATVLWLRARKPSPNC